MRYESNENQRCPYCGSRKGTDKNGICRQCMADTNKYQPTTKRNVKEEY